MASTIDVYVYETPAGPIADFRPYLDGKDNSFSPPRRLAPSDPRWEKIRGTECPRSGRSLLGTTRYLGMAEVDGYHELMVFPIPFEGELPAASEAPAAGGN